MDFCTQEMKSNIDKKLTIGQYYDLLSKNHTECCRNKDNASMIKRQYDALRREQEVTKKSFEKINKEFEQNGFAKKSEKGSGHGFDKDDPVIGLRTKDASRALPKEVFTKITNTFINLIIYNLKNVNYTIQIAEYENNFFDMCARNITGATKLLKAHIEHNQK